MHLTIYFNKKPLILSDSEKGFQNMLHQHGIFFQNQANEASVRETIQEIQGDKTIAGLFLYHDVTALLQLFKRAMKVIEAAGGIVFSNKETVLLIFRRGVWDLPKGKVDAGESIEAAAIREVKEETGLQQLTIKELVMTTYHTYYEKKELVLKETCWYVMTSPEEQLLTPQVEEQIEKCVWVNQNDLTTYFEKTYPLIIDVLKKGLENFTTQGL